MSAQDMINRSKLQKRILANRAGLERNFRNSETFRFVGWGGFHGPSLALIIEEAPVSESIKQLAADGMLRGSYETSQETPLESPLQFVLWLSYQQVLRNNRQNVADIAAGE